MASGTVLAITQYPGKQGEGGYFKLMKSLFHMSIAGLFFFICLMNTGILSSAEAAIDNEYMRGRLSLRENIFLDIDMPVPDDFPNELSQYKLSQLYYPKQMVEPLIDKHFVKKKNGERWELVTSPTSQGQPSLYYKEDDAAHGSLYPSYSGSAYPLNANDPKLVHADGTLKHFLDELGVKQYEYPFYAVMYDYQYDISPRSMIRTQEEFLSTFFPEGRKNLEYYYNKQGTLGKPAIVIAVRFSLDGIPFALKNTYDPDQDGVTGDGNAVPYAMFTLSNDGKIAHMRITRPFAIEKEQPLQRKIFGWKDIIDSTHFARAIAGQQQDGGNLTLLEIEPVYGINKNGVTYPAWRFILEWGKTEHMDERISKDGPDAYVFDLYFDAMAGKSV